MSKEALLHKIRERITSERCLIDALRKGPKSNWLVLAQLDIKVNTFNEVLEMCE